MKILNEQELRQKLAEKAGNPLLDVQTDSGDGKSPEKELKHYLLGLLARREYSQKELRSKAHTRQFDPDLIEQVLGCLVEENLQSDERYCEMLIRSRANKQSGPFKVRMELKQKGINEGLIERALQECDCDWFESARQAAEKKSANWREKDAEHKAKLMRFLQGRGFDGEQVRYAVEACGY